MFPLKFIIRTVSTTPAVPLKLAYASFEDTNPALGKEPPLIVHHGLLGSKSNWTSLCKVYHHRTQRKVIAVDARNHGDSPHSPYHSYDHMAADLKKLLDDFGLTKVALLGHSMGGRAVMYFALKYPTFVEKMIVADASPIAGPAELKSVFSLFDILKSLKLPKNVSMGIARRHTDKILSKYLRNKELRQFVLTNLIQQSDGSYNWRINLPSLVNNFQEILTFPSTKNLKFEGPVLFVRGQKSKFVKKTDFSKILSMFPNAKTEDVVGAGHWLHVEKSSEFLKQTIDFLKEK